MPGPGLVSLKLMLVTHKGPPELTGMERRVENIMSVLSGEGGDWLVASDTDLQREIG